METSFSTEKKKQKHVIRLLGGSVADPEFSRGMGVDNLLFGQIFLKLHEENWTKGAVGYVQIMSIDPPLAAYLFACLHVVVLHLFYIHARNNLF